MRLVRQCCCFVFRRRNNYIFMRKLMIKHLSVFTMLYCGTIANAQDILWEKSYGGKHADYLFDVIPTPDYGFILAGSSLSKKTGNKTEDNRGDLDYWVWKMDEKGELDWQKTIGGTDQDLLKAVVLTLDGGFLLAGTSHSDEGEDKKTKNNGGSDFWIVKLNAKGGEEWQKNIGGIGQDEITTVLKTKDGGFILGGSSDSYASGDKIKNGYGGLDYWVVKINSEGEVKWQNTFGGKYNDELRSITLSDDGGYLLGGSSNSPDNGTKLQNTLGQSDFWIIKIDKDGNEQWQKTIGGTGDDQLYVIQSTADGNYLIAGNSDSESGNDKRASNTSGTDFWVLKLNPEAVILWQETYDIGKIDILTSLVQNEDKTILLGGYGRGETVNTKPLKNLKNKATNSPDNEQPKVKSGTDDYVAIKISETGEELWRKSLGSDGEDVLKKVIETRDGGYLMAGTSKGKISGNKNSMIGSNDFWVVKLKDKQKPKEKKNPIEAIPNPAIDYTNVIVGYDFTKGTATLVDLAGHVLQSFPITERTVPIDLQGLPEGMYIVNIKTEKQSDGVKIIKQRNKN